MSHFEGHLEGAKTFYLLAAERRRSQRSASPFYNRPCNPLISLNCSESQAISLDSRRLNYITFMPDETNPASRHCIAGKFKIIW
jgi:hypothetical protein